jgi:peptide/nickel transport system substrate-binding protein
VEWVTGDHITLKKNPLYFRAAEGLPKFENLVYRFLGEQGDSNIEALLVGECDVVDQTTLLDTQLELILDLQRANKLTAFIGQGPEWEHLDFGIRPASYDDGYQAGIDRPDFFGDLRVRQAFAYCADRAKIIETLFYDQSSVPASYLSPGHPLLAQDLTVLPFDPAAGAKLLDEVGWKDTDGDPQTPRQAFGVAGVADGTALAVNYITTQADLRIETGKILAQSLAECGIQINTQYETPGVVYAAGPDGALFGRKFDLAQFGWESGAQPPCPLYSSEQIPGAGNEWLGTNVTGYSNAAYDTACSQARQARPDQPEYMQQHQEAQRLFNQELPVLPLYYRLHIAVTRPDLCGLEMDVTARSLLWNLESLGYGPYCPVQ